MAHGNRSMLLESFNVKRLINQAILKARGARIVSYPRSGRTWLRLMLHDVSVDARFTHVGSKNVLQLAPGEICQGMEKYARRPIVFLHREPRDTLISYFHHCRRRGVWEGDLATFVRDPRNGFERILAFNLGWMEAQDRFADFTAVAYEDLRADPHGELGRIVRFLRCNLVRARDIEAAIADNTFERMKEREQSGELHARFGDRFTPGGGPDENMIVRRGAVGGHASELSEADAAYCAELMERYDYRARLTAASARANATGPGAARKAGSEAG